VLLSATFSPAKTACFFGLLVASPVLWLFFLFRSPFNLLVLCLFSSPALPFLCPLFNQSIFFSLPQELFPSFHFYSSSAWIFKKWWKHAAETIFLPLYNSHTARTACQGCWYCLPRLLVDDCRSDTQILKISPFMQRPQSVLKAKSWLSLMGSPDHKWISFCFLFFFSLFSS